MGMSEPRELFLHDLRDLYYAEQLLTTALPKLAEEATDPELKAGFEAHLKQTEQHVARLVEAFELLDEEATGEKCPGIDGIKAEHDKFMQDESPSPEICDAFLTGAGARAEHYEIAAYSGLITLGKALGETDAAALFEQNLADEEAALSKLNALAEKLASAQAARS
jgi:ferritin-like metal-binding protein YciE